MCFLLVPAPDGRFAYYSRSLLINQSLIRNLPESRSGIAAFCINPVAGRHKKGRIAAFWSNELVFITRVKP